MSWLGIIAISAGIYLSIGTLIFSRGLWLEWYNGNDLTWEDFLILPVFAVLWIWPLIEYVILKREKLYQDMGR